MRRGESWPALALLLALAPAPALGAIKGSPHDLVAQGYAAPRTGTAEDQCTPCHVDTLDAADPGFFPEVPPSLRGRYGAATLACFSCHDGITLVAPEVDASLTAFHPASHGSVPAGFASLQTEGGLDGAEAKGTECYVCHDPHENRHRPFLRAPLDALCTRCHALFTEKSKGQRAATGSHPVGIDPAASARQEVPTFVTEALRIPFPDDYPLLKARGTVGTHWNLGGHLAGGGAGAIVCATCHAVHGDEDVPPQPGLLAIDPVNKVANQLCEGCHRGQRGDGVESTAAPNPGGTALGRTYHPCDDDMANGTGRLVAIRIPGDWPFGDGLPPRLLCSTCHVSHRAQPGSALLRTAEGAAGFCGECHDQSPAVHHHPTGPSTGACASRLPPAAAGGTPNLTCDLCHRAHNAGLNTGRENDFVPLLRADPVGDASCVSCHLRDNPTCVADPNRRASHFLGDPTLPETYDDLEPPLRTEAWPESGLQSRFGGESGKAVICLSCHSFKPGGLVSGDDGTAGHLIARAGNRVELETGSEATYLCTGCHGVSPGKGKSGSGHHPLQSADLGKLAAPPQPPVTGTPSGHINCDSCHSAHSAHTASGAYMLEIVESNNADPLAIKPPISFTPLCHKCHTSDKY